MALGYSHIGSFKIANSLISLCCNQTTEEDSDAQGNNDKNP